MAAIHQAPLPRYPCPDLEQDRIRILQKLSSLDSRISAIVAATPSRFSAAFAATHLKCVLSLREEFEQLCNDRSRNLFLRALDLTSSSDDLASHFARLSLRVEREAIECPPSQDDVDRALDCVVKPLTIIIQQEATLPKTLQQKECYRLPPHTASLCRQVFRRVFPQPLPDEVVQGCFSRVTIISCNGKTCVLKGIKGSPSKSEKALARIQEEKDQLVREAHYYLIFDHPHILRMLACSYNGLVLERGISDLFTFLQNPAPLSPKLLRRFFSQIAEGLNYLHSLGIVHRDLKPENILYFEGDLLKLCDFGMALPDKTQNDRTQGTPLFFPPEMYRRRTYRVATDTDCWAFGVLVHMVYANTHPFDPDPLTPSLTQEQQRRKGLAIQQIVAKREGKSCSKEDIVSGQFRRGPASYLIERDPAAFFEAVARMCLHGDPPSRVKMAEVCHILRLPPSENYT